MKLFVNILNGLLFSIKDVRLGYVGLQKCENFQRKAKVEQIIAIITTRSVFCYFCNISFSRSLFFKI